MTLASLFRLISPRQHAVVRQRGGDVEVERSGPRELFVGARVRYDLLGLGPLLCDAKDGDGSR